jgi:hypothetical protein
MATRVTVVVPSICTSEGRVYAGPADLSKADLDAIKAIEKSTGRDLIQISRKKATPVIEGDD